MTRHQKIAATAAAMFLFVLLLLLTLPLLFGGRIEQQVRTLIAGNVTADVSWEDARLSLLRGFPHATLRLERPEIVGQDVFAGDTLVAADRLGVVLDLGSVLRAVRGNGALVVRSVQLDRPRAHLLVLEDGSTNWDIMARRAETPDDDARTLALELRSLVLSEGIVRYENRQSGLLARLAGIDHSLSGDFTDERFSIDARVHADTTNLEFAGMPYMSGVALELNTTLDADRATNSITLSDAGLRLNHLVLMFNGSVAAADDELVLDLTFQTPGTSFGDILSLIPAMYANDFAALQASGRMRVEGFVRGAYGPDAFPALALNATVEEGRFRYPDLPLPAREIGASLAITNPGGHADSTVIALERFHMVIGSDPIDASFTVRTPVSDPQLDLRATGTLDLEDLAGTVKMPAVEQLAGVLNADVAVQARYSALDAGAFERVAASGMVTATGIAVRTAELPQEIRIEEARLQLSPQHAELTTFRGTLGSSDVDASGRLDNVLGFALRAQDLRGRASVHSRRFDLNEWRTEKEQREVIPVPAGIDFTLDASADRLVFGPVEYTNAGGAVHVRDQRVTLDGFRMNMLGGSAIATGWYETVQPDHPNFDVQLQLEQIDIPSAFASFNTVRVLAPIAEYAQGRVNADVRLNGAMGVDMMPLYEALTGLGSFETTQLVITEFPAFAVLSDRLHLNSLRQPAFNAVASSFEIRNGRLHVQPFDVAIGGVKLHVQGSNGIDRSLDYDLQLELPRDLLGSNAAPVLASLGADASRLGIDLSSAQQIALGVDLGGTINDPVVETRLSNVAESVTGGVEQALREAVEERGQAVAERVDSAAAARAAALIAEAEQRAEEIRAEARQLAERIRSEGHARADSLEARASNPAARIAARAAAAKLREEADESAERILVEADARAEAIVTEARRNVEAMQG